MAEKGVVIRPSFYEAIISLGEQNQLALFKAICCYGLYGQQPVDLSARAEALFALMKPNLDSASKRYNASVANGKKGGGQAGNQNARKRPRNDQSIQPTDDPNTDTEKEKEKDIDTLCLAQRPAQRKSLLFRERTKCRNPAPFGGHMASWAWAGCPALKEVLSIS